ncbi:putative copper-exporting P-type ATPase A [uncultured archaeon]|nr:putative copper-exporting P-type ATPase A [uncultured archaeon]
MKEITVRTTGMTCASCERAISNALMKVDGISEARPDYASQTTRIVYDEGRVGLEKIKERVEEVGYDFRGQVEQERKSGWKLPFLGYDW